MNRKLFQFAVALMWLALPLTALRYWTVWDQLPFRMATHFDANWHANGWMPRETSFEFALGITAFLLVVFTVACYGVRKANMPDTSAWALLGFFYLVMGFMYFINGKVVDYNLTGQPIHADFAMALIPGAVLIFIAIYLGTQRGAILPVSSVIGEEVHASKFWAVSMAVIGAVELVFVGEMSNARVRVSFAALSVIFLVTAALAWSGFRYLFTNAGIEISTLGFRLRSVPAAQIKQYAVANWSPLRGYGIRGIGSCRAYVWGNRGVRIQTSQGEVFLGHDEPERIVHDLDVMRQFAH